MEISLANRVALVTGANRGIGAAVAESLAEAGADVALHSRKARDEVNILAESLAERHGVRTRVIVGDLSDEQTIDSIFSQFDAHFDRLDILVNNAGFENSHALEEMPLEVWRGVMQVNLEAPFLCSQRAFRRMQAGEHRGGTIINIQSIHDEVVRKGVAHYGVAKSGLKMLTRSAALEWAEYGIRVVGIAPGAIETDINHDDIESLGRDRMNSWIPLGFVGDTADVAGTVVFACSDQARYITGTTLYVDGGYMHNTLRYDERPGHDEIT
ncbi:glucose 1-dehydrogenase [Kushneria sinocarnis]|uniref:Glucose 1-dehydrogenase n=1 Tax=Kushneria sinocarnis TaxID=595502 RepID=A0A420WV50_9GAMM|nr:SDR family oxidoreductase [Kushneria sinocarnis]RKR02438.1 glucose 1-dehydrogenase [Kushneria sinocarnis]